jgi:hypothetical protein
MFLLLFSIVTLNAFHNSISEPKDPFCVCGHYYTQRGKVKEKRTSPLQQIECSD